jgi:hypothetical protein
VGRLPGFSKETVMNSPILIEDIEDVRRREGIVDAALKVDIGCLKPGQSVKLSLATNRNGFETVTVCITSIRDRTIRGRLVKRPKAPGLKALHVGSIIKFQTGHIHSIVGRNNSALSMDRSMATPSRDELLRAARLEADLECERRLPSLVQARRQSQ